MKTSFRSFLLEFGNSDALTAEEAAELINSRGSHYKQLVGNIKENILYRGMRVYYSPDAVLKYVRTNRRPLTTVKGIHQAADEYFESKFGVKFRSQSIFAVGDKRVAEGYGDVYAVFPLDEVKMCWSEQIVDMTGNIHTMLGHVVKDGKRVHASEVLDDEKLGDRAYQLLANANYKMNDESIKKRYFSRIFMSHEMMIHCEDYVAVRQEFLPKVLELLT